MNEALNSPYFYRSWIRHDLQSYKTGKHKHYLSARIRQILTQESSFFSTQRLKGVDGRSDISSEKLPANGNRSNATLTIFPQVSSKLRYLARK
jgi:hypothetical protein